MTVKYKFTITIRYLTFLRYNTNVQYNHIYSGVSLISLPPPLAQPLHRHTSAGYARQTACMELSAFCGGALWAGLPGETP